MLPRRMRSKPTSARRTISALILREMVTTYGRSPGGYLWAVLEPVAAIALLSYVFSLALRSPSLGDNFPIFYATAYLPYMIFQDISAKCARAIRFSRPLLNFAAVTVLDVIFARLILNTLTHLLVMCVLMGGLFWYFNPPTTIDPVAILISIGMALALGLGAGTMNAFLFNMFPAWENIWSVLTRPLFILSGIIFILEDVPTSFQAILAINPVIHATAKSREGYYSIYDAPWVYEGYPFAVGIILFFLGLMLLDRYHDDLLER